jgi:hypothetical protein
MLFGESHLDEIALKHQITLTARLPIDPKLAAACDAGLIELFDGSWLDNMLNTILK